MRNVHNRLLMLTLAIVKNYSVGVGAFSSPPHCGNTASHEHVACIVPSRMQWPYTSSYPSSRHYSSSIDNDDLPPSERDDGINTEAAIENDTDANTTSIPKNANEQQPSKQRQRKRDVLQNTLKRLATLSLKDYEWRSDVFKTNEADRGVEDSLARMMGEDAPSYVRPMDASEESIGPLGKAEKEAVTWLGSVIEEEGKRAQQIADSEGELVRPIDVDDGDGPLAKLEGAAVNFVESIRDSEIERVNNKILRPKDLDATKRGPLGNAEAKLVQAVEEIATSERIRMEMIKQNGGQEVVRPLDVPGPIGELEAKVVEAVEAEKLRAKERVEGEMRRLRPMNATIPGPLGNAERNAMDGLDRLKEEEKERLKNIERFIEEKRPLEVDSDSTPGLAETLTVGLLRTPVLLGKIVDLVKEFISNKPSEVSEEDTNSLPPAAKTNDVPGEQLGSTSDAIDDKQKNQRQG